jgi:uncharacterized protein
MTVPSLAIKQTQRSLDPMNITEELEKLRQMHSSGALSDEEYAKAKERLLANPPVVPTGIPPAPDIEQQTRQWAMFLHLSLLLGLIVFVVGFVAPIVIWQVKKTELPDLDKHGKIVLNWIISSLIYGAISFLLIFVLIGIPLLILLGILAVVFPIIGGIKANNGEVWRYPLSIRFLN